MRIPVRIRTAVLACLAFAVVPASTLAEQPKPPRADASATVGWLHSNVSDISDRFDGWDNRRAVLNGQAGFYWTEHWKTEVAAERSNAQERWNNSSVQLPGGVMAFRASEHLIQDTRVSVGQFYQFGHNAWTHALLGAGLSVTRRHTVTNIQPLIRYDRPTPVTVDPGYTSASNSTRVNLFATAAMKGYVAPRVFVRADLQADFNLDLQAVVMRIGVGVDF